MAKVNLHSKYQGQRSCGAAVRVEKDRWTDRHVDATKCIISLLYSLVDDIKKAHLKQPNFVRVCKHPHTLDLYEGGHTISHLHPPQKLGYLQGVAKKSS